MGDRENWTNGKVQKTESTENLCLRFSECREVTPQKCFKCSHALMLKRNPGWMRGETEQTEIQKTEPTENSHLQFSECQRNISVSHYEKIDEWQ